MRKAISIALLALTGCISYDVHIIATKQYEGHYYTVEQAENAIKNIQLGKNESIWILSNATLKRVLENNK